MIFCIRLYFLSHESLWFCHHISFLLFFFVDFPSIVYKQANKNNNNKRSKSKKWRCHHRRYSICSLSIKFRVFTNFILYAYIYKINVKLSSIISHSMLAKYAWMMSSLDVGVHVWWLHCLQLCLFNYFCQWVQRLCLFHFLSAWYFVRFFCILFFSCLTLFFTIQCTS